MKRIILTIGTAVIIGLSAFSQSTAYMTAGFESIFSFANINYKGSTPNSTIRWAPVINIQAMVNKDISDKFGLFTGLAIRNVGYIFDGYKDPASGNIYKKKFRSYNLSLPIGIKMGNLKGIFAYAGYEIELPVLYKEKTFEGGDKIGKITGWFSSREVLFQDGFFVGVQFPYGFNLKFKYYLSEFNNENYTDASGYKPYAGLKANIFYFSLNFNLFKKIDLGTTGATPSKTNKM
jgi:hypothetical protein